MITSRNACSIGCAPNIGMPPQTIDDQGGGTGTGHATSGMIAATSAADAAGSRAG